MTTPTREQVVQAMQKAKDEFIKRGFWPNEIMWACWRDSWIAARADLEATIAEQAAELESLRKDAERWRDLVSHQVFNNKPQVGYAINRAKERVAAPKQEK